MNERVKTLRKKLGLNQTEFGRRLGVTNPAISKLELGDRNLTEQMILAICREFNVNESWLRDGDGEMIIKNGKSLIEELVTEYELDDLGRKILESFLRLPETRRKFINDYFEEMINSLEATEKMSKHSQKMHPRELTIDEQVALYREQLELAERKSLKSDMKMVEFDTDTRLSPMERTVELTEEEVVELTRQRFRANQKKNVSSTTSESA